MLLDILMKVFNKVILDVPDDKKEELLAKAESLLIEAIKAASEGAAKGATDSLKDGI